MSQYSESYTSRNGESAADPSATDVALDEVADVGQHARQAGGHVAQTATDQARQVVAESGRQVRDLLGEAQGQARDQASAQQQKAAVQLHSVADELGQMAANGEQAGVVTEFARQAADRLHGAGSWLEQREPADLLDEARNFARRRPGTFLLGAALAGLAAGRVTRSLTAERNAQPDTGSGTVTADPASATADPGGFASTGFPAQAEPFDGGVPAHPDGPGSAAGQGYSTGTDPVDSPVPAYLEDPVSLPEPGTAPRSRGVR
jgi:hypothetical protein